ncbi:hypothetical protein D3C86_1898070 [compost metagenome]
MTVQLGHHDIQDSQIYRLGLHGLHSGSPVRSLDRMIALPLQVYGNELSDLRLIIRNQDCNRLHFVTASCFR